MTEIVITFERPVTMSPSELREWMGDLRLAGGRVLAVESSDRRFRLRVAIDGAGEEELTDLMMDMRLLGLRPTVDSTASEDRYEYR